MRGHAGLPGVRGMTGPRYETADLVLSPAQCTAVLIRNDAVPARNVALSC